jgi:hypothetical protein
MNTLALVALMLRARRRRVVWLAAFGALFILAAAAARLLAGDEHGHVEMGRVFEMGGYPLISAIVLLGWLVARFPLVAVLVLMAGVASDDRRHGFLRLWTVRPGSPLRIYAPAWVALALLAVAVSALLLPLVDVILLGDWAGPNTLVLIAAYVLLYGSLTAFFSVWTTADAWLALLVGVGAAVWHGLVRAGAVGLPTIFREVITFLLPPQGALLAVEAAFAGMAPVPWAALAYVAGYSVVLLVVAGVLLELRER